MARNRILTGILSVFVVIEILSFSIGLPIYFRPFYYWQIDSLGITEITGYDKETVIEAYDELLDYLTIPGKSFGTGVFPYSESGKQHFADCKILFALNAVMFVVSSIGIIVLMFLKRKRVFTPARPFGRHFLLTCGAASLSLFALIGALASVNFNKAFMIFHKVFFPGKDNWMLDARVDKIILALPQDFFMNCAILIAASVIFISMGFLVFGVLQNKDTAKGHCV